jgi:hypothetical protein
VRRGGAAGALGPPGSRATQGAAPAAAPSTTPAAPSHAAPCSPRAAARPALAPGPTCAMCTAARSSSALRLTSSSRRKALERSARHSASAPPLPGARAAHAGSASGGVRAPAASWGPPGRGLAALAACWCPCFCAPDRARLHPPIRVELMLRIPSTELTLSAAASAMAPSGPILWDWGVHQGRGAAAGEGGRGPSSAAFRADGPGSAAFRADGAEVLAHPNRGAHRASWAGRDCEAPAPAPTTLPPPPLNPKHPTCVLLRSSLNSATLLFSASARLIAPSSRTGQPARVSE